MPGSFGVPCDARIDRLHRHQHQHLLSWLVAAGNSFEFLPTSDSGPLLLNSACRWARR